jgi:hypothetical protein
VIFGQRKPPRSSRFANRHTPDPSIWGAPHMDGYANRWTMGRLSRSNDGAE